jgi:hypothetical protein
MKTLKVFFAIPFLVLSLNASASIECSDENQFEALREAVQEVLPLKEEKLTFRDDITASSIDALLKRINKVIEKNKGNQLVITLSLDSGGGNINETIRAVNKIRQLNNNPLIEINTKVSSGSCESACTILYTAGEKRLASKYAQFGFHSPKFQSGNKGTMTKKEIEDRYRNIWLGYVSAIDQNAATIIIDRRYLMDEEMSYMSGKELNQGYVTHII